MIHRVLTAALILTAASIGLEANAGVTKVCSQGADYTSGFQALNGAPAGDDILFCRGETFDLGYVHLTQERANSVIGAYGTGDLPILVGHIGLATVWNLTFQDLHFQPIGANGGGIGIYAWYSVGIDLMVRGCVFGNYDIAFGIRVDGDFDQELDLSFFNTPLFSIDEQGNYVPNSPIGLDDIALIFATLGQTDLRTDVNQDGSVGLDDAAIAMTFLAQ